MAAEPRRPAQPLETAPEHAHGRLLAADFALDEEDGKSFRLRCAVFHAVKPGDA